MPFLGKYFSKQRGVDLDPDRLKDVIKTAQDKADEPNPQIPEFREIRKALPEDAPALAGIYQNVFSSYPFPIHDPEYLKETMKTHIDYYVIFDEDHLIAAASAEKEEETKTVEMTDFATIPEHRKKGLAFHLLQAMETAVAHNGYKISYTIARALSFGMNITFARNGYQFCGTLINNTHIAGEIESMNVWSKHL